MSLDDHVIRGRLDNDSSPLLLPKAVSFDGKPYATAFCHRAECVGKRINEGSLTYLVLPEGVKLHVEEQKIPIVIDRPGDIPTVDEFHVGEFEITMGSLTVAKLHPRVTAWVNAEEGTTYHQFTVWEAPANFRGSRQSVNFVYDGKTAQVERLDRLIQFPGVLLFPEKCAYRIPGWLTGTFNGSPELGFAYSPFTEPREGEVLHTHRDIMEPYIGLEGVAHLFVGMEDGSERLDVVDPSGQDRTYRGEIVEIGPRDVVIPKPGVPHKILFDRGTFPFTMYCLNYAAGGLDNVAPGDRTVLERK